MYQGKGSGALSEIEGAGGLEYKAAYDQGRWTAVFKRKREVENGVSFTKEESFIPIGFSAWDGTEEERGNKRGLTTWFSLYIEPLEKPSATGPMIKVGLGFLLIELLIIFAVRRRKKTAEA